MARKEYEYKSINNGSDNLTVADLNEQGLEGWEAIGLLNQTTILLKRELLKVGPKKKSPEIPWDKKKEGKKK